MKLKHTLILALALVTGLHALAEAVGGWSSEGRALVAIADNTKILRATKDGVRVGDNTNPTQSFDVLGNFTVDSSGNTVVGGTLAVTGAVTLTTKLALTSQVTGILPTANGGTGIAFFTAAGPTVARVYTFPDAAATVLTTNAAVTVAQGGTGVATFTANGVLYGNAAGTVLVTAQGPANSVLTANAGAPSFSATPTVTSLTATGAVTSTGATSGIGYGTGAGGVVTQLTNKSTGVTLNAVTARITMNGAALAGDTAVTFTWTNSAIAATDDPHCRHESAGTAGSYLVAANPAAGSADVTVRNITPGSLSEAIVIKCTVFKSVTS